MKRYLDDNGRLQSPVIARRPNGEPILIEIPSMNDIRKLTDGELFDIARQMGTFKSWPEMSADSAAMINKLALIPQNSPSYDAMVQDFVDTIEGTRNVLLEMARGSVRDFINESLASQAWPNTEFIRISEGDEAVCENCEELAGTIGTFAQHIAEGLPGPMSCLGENYCRCVLVEVE